MRATWFLRSQGGKNRKSQMEHRPVALREHTARATQKVKWRLRTCKSLESARSASDSTPCLTLSFGQAPLCPAHSAVASISSLIILAVYGVYATDDHADMGVVTRADKVLGIGCAVMHSSLEKRKTGLQCCTTLKCGGHHNAETATGV